MGVWMGKRLQGMSYQSDIGTSWLTSDHPIASTSASIALPRLTAWLPTLHKESLQQDMQR